MFSPLRIRIYVALSSAFLAALANCVPQKSAIFIYTGFENSHSEAVINSTNEINAMIIKPNQNGSFIELQEIFNICKKHNIKTIMDDIFKNISFGVGMKN